MNESSVTEFSPHRFEDFPPDSMILIYSPEFSNVSKIYKRFFRYLEVTRKLDEVMLFFYGLKAKNGCVFYFESGRAEKVNGKEFDYLFATKDTDPIMLRFLKSRVRPRQ